MCSRYARSHALASGVDVTLEFAWGTDMDFASIDVREKLDALQLPLEVERPVILRFDPTLDPVYAVCPLYRRRAGACD
ncbi:MAG: hypothetical protein U5K69_24235 [Balneolaceae bacterium]|nr:hypothetical protein [Balneolaceae bacterium]